MNQRLLEELAHQHIADLQRRPRRDSAACAPGEPLAAGRGRESSLTRAISSANGQPRLSLRERTGWTLVGLGLRMAATPRPVR